MKKSLFLLAFLAIVFIANPEAKAQCPPGWDGPNSSTVTVNGCTYIAQYCWRVYMGLHELSIGGWSILPPCDPTNFESNPTIIKEAVLIQIAESGFFKSEWDDDIPECPDNLCIIRWHDAVCYSGWIPITLPPPNGGTLYIMDVCDNEVRSCNETIRFCWETDENGVRTLNFWRQGYPSGEPCLAPCKLDCD